MPLQLIAFLLLAIPSSACGSISVWNGNVFFGHVFAHALLLPPAVCYFFGIYSDLAIFFCSAAFGLVFAAFFAIVDRRSGVRNGFSLLMFSLVTTGFSVLLAMNNNATSLDGYIMGDIAFITKWQIAALAVITCFYLAYMYKYRNIMALAAINSDLARLQNKHVDRLRLIEILVRSILIVLGARMFGVLLISNALIAPAMITVGFSKSPQDMLVKSSALAIITSQVGLLIGMQNNLHPAAVITIIYGLMASAVMIMPRDDGRSLTKKHLETHY